MKIKTSELIDGPLDWAVAKAGNVTVKLSPTGFLIYTDKSIPTGPQGRVYQPSTNWSQGGPIIDQLTRRGLHIHGRKCRYTTDATSVNVDVNGHYAMSGPTLLIAAMRCFVASRLGDEVDVPEELL